MDVTGKIKVINEVQQVSASFKKRELVVTTDEQYPQHILIEFNQDKCDILNQYKLGDHVKVDINLRGREWVNPQGETKYFNQIQGWRISKTEVVNDSAVDNYKEKSIPATPIIDEAKEEDDSQDLPF